MQLHDFTLSGNCYKVRLFLALLGRQVELLQVDLRGGAQKRPEFLALGTRRLARVGSDCVMSEVTA